jgi:hypothetical protein
MTVNVILTHSPISSASQGLFDFTLTQTLKHENCRSGGTLRKTKKVLNGVVVSCKFQQSSCYNVT